MSNDPTQTMKSRQNMSTGVDHMMKSGYGTIDHPGKSNMKKGLTNNKVNSYQTSFQVDKMNQMQKKMQDQALRDGLARMKPTSSP